MDHLELGLRLADNYVETVSWVNSAQEHKEHRELWSSYFMVMCASSVTVRVGDGGVTEGDVRGEMDVSRG